MKRSRSVLTTLFPVLLAGWSCILLAACDSDSTAPEDPVRQEIVVAAGAHHIGDNSGAEGTTFTSEFQVPSSFDSASVSISFLFPNALDVSGPEIDSPPRVTLNGSVLGLTPSDFPANPACITGTGPGREYSCDISFSLPATSALEVGTNTISVISEAASGGDDDFVFSDVLVIVWR